MREIEHGINVAIETTVDQEINALGDAIFEMANLTPDQTGVVGGIVFISTKMGSHGPRVKFSLKPGRNQPSFSVSISDTPVVVSESSGFKRTVAAYSSKVIEFVDLNKTILLDFWMTGDTWLDPQVQSMIANLHRV